MHHLNNRLENFLGDIDSLEMIYKRLKDERDAVRDAGQAQLKADKEAHDAENRLLLNNYQRAKEQLAEVKAAVRKELDEAQRQYDAAQSAHAQKYVERQGTLKRKYQSELDALRAQQDGLAQRERARLLADLAAAKQKLERVLDEYDRTKKNNNQEEAELTTQLAMVRRENADLQRRLGAAEAKRAERIDSLQNRVKDSLGEVQRTREAIIQKDMQLATITEANAAILREVQVFRSVLDREKGRITPYKVQKTSPAHEDIHSAPVPIRQISMTSPESTSPVQPPTPTVTPSKLHRRSSMKQTMEDAAEVLVRMQKINKDCIILNNDADFELSIGEWRIVCESDSDEFEFPEGTRIAGNSTVTVWCAGAGKQAICDGKADFCWESKKKWDSKDSAVMFSANDKQIQRIVV